MGERLPGRGSRAHPKQKRVALQSLLAPAGGTRKSSSRTTLVPDIFSVVFLGKPWTCYGVRGQSAAQLCGGGGVLGPLSLLFICVWSLSRAACLGSSKWALATQKVPLLHVPLLRSLATYKHAANLAYGPYIVFIAKMEPQFASLGLRLSL